MRVEKSERPGRYASDKELDENTGKKGDEDVDQGELALPRRVLGLLRGEQGRILVLVRGVVILGIWPRLDVLRISGVHTSM